MIEIQKETYRYRLTAEPLMAKEPESINNTKKLYDYLMSYVYKDDEIQVREYFYAVFLNSDSRVKGFIKVSEGGVGSCPVDPKIIFSAALKCLATVEYQKTFGPIDQIVGNALVCKKGEIL